MTNTKNFAEAWYEGCESLGLEMIASLGDDGFRPARVYPYTDEAMVTAWNQGREAVTLEPISPAKNDGTRPVTQCPYEEK